MQSLEPVFSEKAAASCPTLTGLFDRSGHDGPWAVTGHGDLYDTARSELHRLSLSINGAELVAANRAGDRVVIRQRYPKWVSTQEGARLVDVDRRAVRSMSGAAEQMVNFDAIHPWIVHATLRHRFQAATLDGGLVLVSRKGIALRLTWDAGQRRIHLTALPKGRSYPPPVPLTACAGPEGVGYRLTRAVLDEDGTKVYTDSRGLLHLRDGDRSCPEVTLVLNETHMAGWCSSGGAWGLPFYTGRNEATPPPASCRRLLSRMVANFS